MIWGQTVVVEKDIAADCDNSQAQRRLKTEESELEDGGATFVGWKKGEGRSILQLGAFTAQKSVALTTAQGCLV